MGTPFALDILYIRPGGSGWGPVSDLVSLTSRVFGACVIEVDDQGEVSYARKASALLPRRRRRANRGLLVVAANPAAAAYLARPRLWFNGYDSVACWIIDSFWTDRTPRVLRSRPHVDQLFITDPELVDEWTILTGLPTACLPWGADTLRFPSVSHRPVDLLRLGRQPAAWDDDAATATDATHHGLVFRGRPPMSADPAMNQEAVRVALLDSKLVLAFSNLVSPAAYTHPTRDYLTGRWMDALAAGCTVVGAAPASASVLLWDGATVEIDPTSRDASWATLREAVAKQTPERARMTQQRARQLLDWRWRLRDLSQHMGWPMPPRLAEELIAVSASTDPE